MVDSRVDRVQLVVIAPSPLGSSLVDPSHVLIVVYFTLATQAQSLLMLLSCCEFGSRYGSHIPTRLPTLNTQNPEDCIFIAVRRLLPSSNGIFLSTEGILRDGKTTREDRLAGGEERGWLEERKEAGWRRGKRLAGGEETGWRGEERSWLKERKEAGWRRGKRLVGGEERGWLEERKRLAGGDERGWLEERKAAGWRRRKRLAGGEERGWPFV